MFKQKNNLKQVTNILDFAWCLLNNRTCSNTATLNKGLACI